MPVEGVTITDKDAERLKGQSFKVTTKPNGIPCPKCGREMFDVNPDELLLSKPPKLRTKCPGCEYASYRNA